MILNMAVVSWGSPDKLRLGEGTMSGSDQAGQVKRSLEELEQKTDELINMEGPAGVS